MDPHRAAFFAHRGAANFYGVAGGAERRHEETIQSHEAAGQPDCREVRVDLCTLLELDAMFFTVAHGLTPFVRVIKSKRN